MRLRCLLVASLFTFVLPLAAQTPSVDTFREICQQQEIPGWQPVGCELIDCCPNCPGDGSLVISFKGKPNDRLTIDLAGARSRIRTSGNARIVGKQVVIEPGKSTISGIAPGALRKTFGAAHYSGEGPLTGSVEYRRQGKTISRQSLAYRFVDCPLPPNINSGNVKPVPGTRDDAPTLNCPTRCASVIRFMTDHEVPANIGISIGPYREVTGFDHINVFVQFTQPTANEEPVDLGVMFAFDASGRMGSRRYVNLESNVSSPQSVNFISVSGANSWHGTQTGISSYTVRLPVMGPYVQVFVYNRAATVRHVSVWAYLSK